MNNNDFIRYFKGAIFLANLDDNNTGRLDPVIILNVNEDNITIMSIHMEKNKISSHENPSIYSIPANKLKVFIGITNNEVIMSLAEKIKEYIIEGCIETNTEEEINIREYREDKIRNRKSRTVDKIYLANIHIVINRIINSNSINDKIELDVPYKMSLENMIKILIQSQLYTRTNILCNMYNLDRKNMYNKLRTIKTYIMRHSNCFESETELTNLIHLAASEINK